MTRHLSRSALRGMAIFLVAGALAPLSGREIQGPQKRPVLSVKRAAEKVRRLKFTLDTFQMSTVQVHGQTFTRLKMEGSSPSPGLPFCDANLVLAPDSSLRATVEEQSFENLILEHPPEGLDREGRPLMEDHTESYSVGKPYIYRDLRGVSIRIHPFRYDPATQTLRVTRNFTLLLEECRNESPDQAISARATALPPSEMIPLYRNFFLDQDRIPAPPLPPRGGILVIAPPRYREVLQPFVEHKTRLGVKITLRELPKNMDIQALIRDEYEADPCLLYVHLAGDQDEIPSPKNAEGHPADAQLGWITPDPYAELLVDRFRASNPQELVHQINQIIADENAPTQCASPDKALPDKAHEEMVLPPTPDSSALPKVATVGKPCADITGVDSVKQPVKLSDFKGKVILLEVTSAWCRPSNKTARLLDSFNRKYKDKGLVCVTCLTDGATQTNASEWVRKHQSYMPIITDAKGRKGPSETFYVKATGFYPTYVVIDKKSNARLVVAEEVEKALTMALSLLSDSH